MDTKFIQQYGEDILSYRLRTARQKKRMQYTGFEKNLRTLDREYSLLRREIRNLGWEPLVPPVQRGWKRFFVLRDDVARSKQADFFQGILNRINTYDWSHRRDFLVKKRRKILGRKIYVVKRQRLLLPEECHFRRLAFTEREQQLFHIEFRTEAWSKKAVKRYVFAEPWRFVLRVRPNIIEKVRKRNEVMETRMKAIESYLERTALEWTQHRLIWGSCKWRHWYLRERPGEVYRFRNWPVEKIVDSLEDET